MKKAILTREPQYARCLDAPPVTLGPMTGWTHRQNPLKLGMTLARYKFVAKMLEGTQHVAEIGCGDGFGSHVVAATVGNLDLFDFDPVWRPHAESFGSRFYVHDITKAPLSTEPIQTYERYSGLPYSAIYMLDVIEHIRPEDEPTVTANICASLTSDGVFIAGCPSLESQVYASEISKAGHVNCKSGDKFRDDLKQYFRNVFRFSMSDEVVHTGFAPMAHYLLALCTGPRRR